MMEHYLPNGIFQYCIHTATTEVPDMTHGINFGTYTVYIDARTPVSTAKLPDRELIILGLATDVRSSICSADLPQRILETTTTLAEVISEEFYLGGKYLLFYREQDACYAVPDATASIPFCYSVGPCPSVCSSTAAYVARHLHLSPDPQLQAIRDRSDIAQAMPYDVTIYQEIKQLLPNHWYSFSAQKAYRFINAKQSQTEISPQQAATHTAPYIAQLAHLYQSNFKLYCPITAGRDSRVVLAFLLAASEKKSDLKCYTIRHRTHTGNEQDLTVPTQLAAEFSLQYEQITDALPHQDLICAIDALLGYGQYSQRTLMIANTVHEHFRDGAIINGDIIGQVGKCSLHRDIPLCLASAAYFRCKLHNFSREAKSLLKQWLNEIKDTGEKVNPFDLFSIESRMGRWASQENTIYNTVGQVYLNIFNSRSIIYEWSRVDRALRKRSAIHLALLELCNQSLLSVPFEVDNSPVVKLSKANGIFYYVSSFLKFWIQKIAHYLH